MSRVIASALTLTGVLLGAGASAQEMKDPEAWFLEDYAPLWSGDMTTNMEKLKEVYAPEILNHDSSGEVYSEAQETWFLEPMQGWLADGWLGAELVSVEVSPVNASTAVFSAVWLDRYRSGETEDSCGWYLADAIDGRWIITEYADQPCP